MKPLKQTSTLIVIVMVAFYGCSNPTSEKEKPTDEPTTKKVKASAIANKDNPYDKQGKMYSEFLDGVTQFNGDVGDWDVSQLADSSGVGGWDVSNIAAFNGDVDGWDVSQIAAYDDSSGGWDVSNIMRLAIDYDEEHGIEPAIARELVEGMLQHTGRKLGEVDIEDTCWYHPKQCEGVDTRLANPVDILDPSNNDTSHDRIIKYINAVKEKEADITSNNKIEKAEKKELLVAYSIARHAAGYWFNTIVKGDHPWEKHRAEVKNAVNMTILESTTASKVLSTAPSEYQENDNVGVPTAILTLYILNKYGK